MSKAPTQRPRPGKAAVGSRSFTRRNGSRRERVAQGTVTQAQGRPASPLGGMLARLPRVAWICAAVALLNAFAWSLITPLFQGKDEADHYAYVERLAHTGKLPVQNTEYGGYSSPESLVLGGLNYIQTRFTPYQPAISTSAQQQALMQDVKEAGRAESRPEGSGGAGIAAPEPPLYYALQTIPYELGGNNILIRMQLMRLFGVLLAGITTLFVFLFLREILPRVPWAATIGALCVALQPLFGFMSGSVNPDTMLFTVAAAIFYCLARAFRRGLSRRLAMVLGLLIVTGFATKLNFIGFAFGVFAGLILLTVREARVRGRREALRSLAIAGGIGLGPVLLYALHNALVGHSTFGTASGVANTVTLKSLWHQLSYTWELYLPRLPGMPHYFLGIATFKDIWFDRSVGLYGWMDTTFPGWVDNIALIPAAAVALLCGRELYVRREELRARLGELCVYGAITLGVLAMLGISSYQNDAVVHEAAFGEPRYLLPMLPLLGAVLVLAMRGAGRKWAPVVGAALVMLFLGHDIFSQLQVIGRYYG